MALESFAVPLVTATQCQYLNRPPTGLGLSKCPLGCRPTVQCSVIGSAAAMAGGAGVMITFVIVVRIVVSKALELHDNVVP
jgi:hypothetical protein